MNSTAKLDPNAAARQIKTLAESARVLVARGDLASAEEIYRRILDAAPYHGPALSFFAKQANDAGEREKALGYIDKAIQGNPGKPLHILNRARTYSDMGKFTEALTDLDAVLALSPNHTGTLFHKALLLKELGDRKAAVKTAIQGWGSYANPESLASDPDAPPYLREQVVECANLIRSTQLILIDSELEPAIERHGKPSLERLFESISAYSGLLQNAQTATGNGFSIHGLAAQAPAMADAPWKRRLSENLARFKEAADGQLALDSKVRAKSSRPIQSTPAWELLSKQEYAVPLVSAPENEAALVLAPAGTTFLSRQHPQNWKISVYLPLDAPPAATITSGRDVMDVRPGHSLTAGSGSDHILHNPGPDPLRIMRFDVWHPDLSVAEQEGIPAVFRAIRKFDAQYKQTSSTT